MRLIRSLATAALLGSILLVGCEKGGPTEPAIDGLTLEDEIALELLADPSTTQTALDLTDVQTSAAYRRGWGGGSTHRSQAESSFQEARQALAQGDLLRARDRARDGRQLVAQDIEMAGGQQAILGMVERMEALPVMVAADPGAFNDPATLGQQLGRLAQQARAALGAGDPTGAGAMGVLAEQAFRYRQRDQNEEVGRQADLAVALAEEAIALAEGLLEQPLDDPEQADILDTAVEYLTEAQAALADGENARAAHLAHLAQWWALKAVVLPGGITDDDARLIQEVAEPLLEEATEAVEGNPTDVNVALLARATLMLEHGEENLGNGNCRGLGALWQSAVNSAYLIP